MLAFFVGAMKDRVSKVYVRRPETNRKLLSVFFEHQRIRCAGTLSSSVLRCF
jgi:hypothetical protein